MPKQGILIQLGDTKVRRITPQVRRLEVQKYVGVTLNVNKEATPPEVWRKMQQGRESSLLTV